MTLQGIGQYSLTFPYFGYPVRNRHQYYIQTWHY